MLRYHLLEHTSFSFGLFFSASAVAHNASFCASKLALRMRSSVASAGLPQRRSCVSGHLRGLQHDR